jgi:hypothetical protein
LEPGILAAGVIGNEIDDDVNPTLVRFSHQIPKIIVGPVPWIDVVIVDHIVPVIAHGFVDWHQPDAIRAQAFAAGRIPIIDVVEPRDESAQVPDPVAVSVGKGAHEHFVAHAAAPPWRRKTRHGREMRWASSARAADREHQKGESHKPCHRWNVLWLYGLC